MMITIALCTLAGCGSNKTIPTNSSDPAKDRSGWFCQVGVSNEEWECVQSATLARSPKPTRLPSVRREPSPPDPALTDPASADAEFSSRNQTRIARSSTEPAPTKPTQPQPAQPEKQQATTNMPRHVELSYRPKKPIAILDLPADFFAVQLVAVSSKELLEKFAKKNKIRGMSAARVWNGEKLFYILLLGIYETKANATEAIESLAPPFDEMNPWIRSLGSLQRSMLDADREAGTTDI